MYGHYAPRGCKGGVVAARRLHHVAQPEDVAEPGPGVRQPVGADRVVNQVVAVILISEIGKP